MFSNVISYNNLKIKNFNSYSERIIVKRKEVMIESGMNQKLYLMN